MLTIYIPDNSNKFSSDGLYNLFGTTALSLLQGVLYGKLNLSKCDNYDKVLLTNPNIKNTDIIKSNSHFTYNLLLYIIRNIKHSIGAKNEHIFYVPKYAMTRFGSFEDISLILRLIEFGDCDNIQPYQIFNKSIVEFKHKLSDIYNGFV